MFVTRKKYDELATKFNRLEARMCEAERQIWELDEYAGRIDHVVHGKTEAIARKLGIIVEKAPNPNDAIEDPCGLEWPKFCVKQRS